MGFGEPRSVTPVTGARLAPAERDGVDHPPRVIRRRPGLPGTRAVVGALLMALAAIGVFVAYADARRGPTDPVVIARHAIRIGETLEPGDLEVVTADLPSQADGSFEGIDELVGRAALGPIGAGEIVQSGSVTEDQADTPGHEIALTLPREQVAVGHLEQGDRVDVFVTRDDRTISVARGVQVVQIGSDRDGTLTSERELSIVVAVPSDEVVAGLVHALRTGEVTVVRSTFAELDDGPPLEVTQSPPGSAPTEGAGRAGG